MLFSANHSKFYAGHYCFPNPVWCLLERRLKVKFSVSIVEYLGYYRRVKYKRFLSFPSLATQNSHAFAACAAVVDTRLVTIYGLIACEDLVSLL